MESELLDKILVDYYRKGNYFHKTLSSLNLFVCLLLAIHSQKLEKDLGGNTNFFGTCYKCRKYFKKIHQLEDLKS